MLQDEMIAYQQVIKRRLSETDQKIIMEKFIKFVKQENARGNLDSPDFEIRDIAKKAIKETFDNPRRKMLV